MGKTGQLLWACATQNAFSRGVLPNAPEFSLPFPLFVMPPLSPKPHLLFPNTGSFAETVYPRQVTDVQSQLSDGCAGQVRTQSAPRRSFGGGFLRCQLLRTDVAYRAWAESSSDCSWPSLDDG